MGRLSTTSYFVVIVLGICSGTTNVTDEAIPNTGHCVLSGMRSTVTLQHNPGENVTFTCTVPSLIHRLEIQTPFDCISRSLAPADQNQDIQDGPFTFTVTTNGTSITSRLTLTATSELNGTVVLCGDASQPLPESVQGIILVTDATDSTSRPEFPEPTTDTDATDSTSRPEFPEPTTDTVGSGIPLSPDNGTNHTKEVESPDVPNSQSTWIVGITVVAAARFVVVEVVVYFGVGLAVCLGCAVCLLRKRNKQKAPPPQPRAIEEGVPGLNNDLDNTPPSTRSPKLTSPVQQPLIEEDETDDSVNAEEDSSAENDTVLNTATSPKLPPPVHQLLIEEKETCKNADAEVSPAENDDLDNTPPSTRSPKLTSPVQQPLIEEDETDDSVNAKEDSSAENGAPDHPSTDDPPTCSSTMFQSHILNDLPTYDDPEGNYMPMRTGSAEGGQLKISETSDSDLSEALVESEDVGGSEMASAPPLPPPRRQQLHSSSMDRFGASEDEVPGNMAAVKPLIGEFKAPGPAPKPKSPPQMS